MATKTKTRRENLKKQMETIIETAQYTDTRSWRGDTREVYTMHHSGTFTAEYEIRPTGWTRAEMEEELRRRARRIDNRRDINAKKLDLRSNRLQRAMAFIGEHREIIPFLAYYQERRKSKGFTAIYNDWKRKGGAPSPIMDGWANYGRSIKQPELGDLVAQLPYIPKAWRCA